MCLVCAVTVYAESTYVDVVTTNEGNIYKGIIVENKIDEYIKIELPGGSVFKFDYEDIDTIGKEKVEADEETSGQQIIIQQTQNVNQETNVNTGSTGNTGPPIIFFPKTGLFSLPFYTFHGAKYQVSRTGGGYLSMIEAIEISASPTPELQTMISDYKQYIKTSKTLYWSGWGAYGVGLIWSLKAVFDYIDTSDTYGEYDTMGYLQDLIPPYTLVIGGAVLMMIGQNRSQKEPSNIVSYYNLNY